MKRHHKCNCELCTERDEFGFYDEPTWILKTEQNLDKEDYGWFIIKLKNHNLAVARFKKKCVDYFECKPIDRVNCFFDENDNCFNQEQIVSWIKINYFTKNDHERNNSKNL